MLFYLKKQKDYTIGKVPVYLRITVDGKRAEIITNRSCEPEKQNSDAERIIGTKEYIKSFNSYLDNLQSEAYEAHSNLYENDKLITAETLKNKILGKKDILHLLLKQLKEHNRKVKNLVGQKFASATYKRYETSLRHTQTYLKHQYGLSDINADKVDNAFV